jgi:hypothetical protein
MKKLFQIGLLLLLATPVVAQESSAPNPPKVLRTYNWKDLNVQSTNCQIQIVSMDGMSVLKIENTNSPPPRGPNNSYPIYAPLEFSLLKITNSVVKKTYWVSCELKFENVWSSLTVDTNGLPGFENPRLVRQEEGDLKLLAYFPPSASGGDERVKTTDSNFSGTSNWQLRKLTVDNTRIESLPTHLELKLSLPAHGTVYLRPIKLLGTAHSFDWWSEKQAGLIGGIGGSIIGCCGALVGVLASRGKARKFVLALTKTFIVLGIFLLLAGTIAAALKQPYAVYYPLLLMGFILTLVCSINLPSIQRRYDELEIRRMTSVDTLGN